MKEKTSKMGAEEFLRKFHPEKRKALEKLLLRGEVADLMEEYASLKQSEWISVEDELLIDFLRQYQKSCEIMHVTKIDAKNFVEQYRLPQTPNNKQ